MGGVKKKREREGEMLSAIQQKAIQFTDGAMKLSSQRDPEENIHLLQIDEKERWFFLNKQRMRISSNNQFP